MNSPVVHIEAFRLKNSLQNPWGAVWAAAIVLLIAAAVQLLSQRALLMLMLIPAGLLCLLLTLRYRLFAVACGFVLIYAGALFNRLTGLAVPFGILTDLLVWIMFIGLLVSAADKGRFNFWNPVTLVLAAGLLYTIFQALNPELQSREGYWIGLRKAFSFFLLQTVILYEVYSFRRLKQLLAAIMWLTFAVCLYGCYCEWFGLPEFEYRWLATTPKAMGLIFIDGKFRVFSSLSDPAAFGILMAMAAVFSAGMLLAPFRLCTKLVWAVLTVLFVLGASYSGTRTAYAMFFAGLLMLFLLNLHRRAALLLMLWGAVLLLLVWFLPVHDNPTLNRIRSVFHPSKDASMNVREFNRRRVQPYMWEHPIGGGIGTTGELGAQTQPAHPLAGLPPDSGYVRTALETGWIGLLIQCISYATVMIYAVWQMFGSRKKLTRSLYAAIVAVLFCGALGQFAQFSDNIFFLILMPLTVKLRLMENTAA